MSPSNPRLKTALSLILALGAIAPAAASPRPDLNPPAPSPQPSVQVLRVTAPSGFDWGDAAIGIAGGLGLSMLAVGGTVVVRRHASAR